MAMFASVSFEPTAENATSQMVEISSESQTTDSSLPPGHGPQNEELYASIPDTVALANTCSLIDTPDEGLNSNIYQTPPGQAVPCPAENLSSSDVQKSGTSDTPSTRRLAAVALGPLHGESYTSFPAQNSNSTPDLRTAFHSGAYEVLPDQETLNEAEKVSESPRGCKTNNLPQDPTLHMGKRETAEELGSVDGDFYASVSTRGTSSDFVSVVDMADTFEDWTNIGRAFETLSNDISSHLEITSSLTEENGCSPSQPRLKQAVSLGSFIEDPYATVPRETSIKDSSEEWEKDSCPSLSGQDICKSLGNSSDDMCVVTEGASLSDGTHGRETTSKRKSVSVDNLDDHEATEAFESTTEMDQGISTIDGETRNENQSSSSRGESEAVPNMSENADNVAPESTNVYASIPEDGPSGLGNDASMDNMDQGGDACDIITASESGLTGEEAEDSECNTPSPCLGPSSSDVYASISDN